MGRGGVVTTAIYPIIYIMLNHTQPAEEASSPY